MGQYEKIILICNVLIFFTLLLWPSLPPFAEQYDDIVPGSSLTNEDDTDWSERDNVYGKGGSSFEEQNTRVDPPLERDTQFITREIYKIDRDAQAYQGRQADSARGRYLDPSPSNRGQPIGR